MSENHDKAEPKAKKYIVTALHLAREVGTDPKNERTFGKPFGPKIYLPSPNKEPRTLRAKDGTVQEVPLGKPVELLPQILDMIQNDRQTKLFIKVKPA